jgi:hypothetical protein
MSKKFQQTVLKLFLEEESEDMPPPNSFTSQPTKLFDSDSDTSLFSEQSGAERVETDKTPSDMDYSNFAKLFERKPSEETLASSSSSSFILEDYNTFRNKISSKRKLHK